MIDMEEYTGVHSSLMSIESNTPYFEEPWKRLIALDDIALCVLSTVTLKNSETHKDLLARRDASAQSLLNLLQAVRSRSGRSFSPLFTTDNQNLDYPMHESVRRLHTKVLISLSKRSGLYPECLVLRDVQLPGKFAVARGGYGDVWRGMFQGKPIAVKVLHVYERSNLVKLLKVSAVHHTIVSV